MGRLLVTVERAHAGGGTRVPRDVGLLGLSTAPMPRESESAHLGLPEVRPFGIPGGRRLV